MTSSFFPYLCACIWIKYKITFDQTDIWTFLRHAMWEQTCAVKMCCRSVLVMASLWRHTVSLTTRTAKTWIFCIKTAVTPVLVMGYAWKLLYMILKLLATCANQIFKSLFRSKDVTWATLTMVWDNCHVNTWRHDLKIVTSHNHSKYVSRISTTYVFECTKFYSSNIFSVNLCDSKITNLFYVQQE